MCHLLVHCSDSIANSVGAGVYRLLVHCSDSIAKLQQTCWWVNATGSDGQKAQYCKRVGEGIQERGVNFVIKFRFNPAFPDVATRLNLMDVQHIPGLPTLTTFSMDWHVTPVAEGMQACAHVHVHANQWISMDAIVCGCVQ